MTIYDASQRTRALDPAHSFIVQAPAGSGKTELLTQRLLVLLSLVKMPEEVLAITFTKKSAAEMRARIMTALKNAATMPEPESAHAKITWKLARKVLQQDKAMQWRLLANPTRLRIQTIDSFNTGLTRQLPVLSHFGAPPDITEDAQPLYRQAVQEFLSHLEDNYAWSDAIATLLLHMDNDLNQVESLLINLLAKRDQWLPYIIGNANDINLREKLEAHLGAVVSDILETICQRFPSEHIDELLFLARFAADNLPPEKTDSPIFACRDLQSIPGHSTQDRIYWMGLRELLFTKSDEWRKLIDKNLGFPPKCAEMKIRLTELIHHLSPCEEIKNAFKELKHAPSYTYQETQWRTLEALHQVLCVVVAQLNVVFQQHGKIDFIENAQAALKALGTDEDPTDLTLALDYQIKHILIDEFQDTSNSQYRLLQKLTAGWETADGRTLFLVGDPMQSIYRFREAEVGLFIRARLRGIGQIKLEPLTLSVNFRSTANIVNWINGHFHAVFPGFNDIATGAVSYSNSRSNQDTHVSDSTVALNSLFNEDSSVQAKKIVELIQQRKFINPKETIAILTRSRTHLEEIIPALKAANLAYRAIDIDPLTARPFIQDLIALTRALIHPADRIAWLSVLRAPWCGLTLSDLLLLSGDDAKITLWDRLLSSRVLATLSDDGQQRLNRVLPVFKIKLGERRRCTLRYWIESTWLLLGGPACTEQASDLEDALTYFKLLEKLDHGSDLPNLNSLSDYVEKLFAAPNHQADETLQIMTIHNAKGLEFDTVILPHLERKASNDDKQLLLWMERPRANASNALVLAPVHGMGEENDSIYDYIKRQHAIKNEYEQSRLLYVAATRAKKNLYLFFNLKKEDRVTSSSLLDKLWPTIKNEVHLPPTTAFSIEPVSKIENEQPPLPIKRLPLEWHNPVSENRLADQIQYHQKNEGFFLPDNHPKYIGIVVHQILQQICRAGLTWWETQPDEHKASYLHRNLLQLGMINTAIPIAITTIKSSIDATLNDPRGRWILSPQQDSQAEYPITALIENELHQLIIDRTFVDENNIRWIIDYKTSTCDNAEELETFLETEQQKYKMQMLHYFQAMRQTDSRPIRVGLYFPLLPAWREWVFD